MRKLARSPGLGSPEGNGCEQSAANVAMVNWDNAESRIARRSILQGGEKV